MKQWTAIAVVLLAVGGALACWQMAPTAPEAEAASASGDTYRMKDVRVFIAFKDMEDLTGVFLPLQRGFPAGEVVVSPGEIYIEGKSELSDLAGKAITYVLPRSRVVGW